MGINSEPRWIRRLFISDFRTQLRQSKHSKLAGTKVLKFKRNFVIFYLYMGVALIELLYLVH